MKRRAILWMIMWLISAGMMAQEVYLTVIDGRGDRVYGAEVTDSAGAVVALTDIDGKATWPCQVAPHVVTAFGFESQPIVIDACDEDQEVQIVMATISQHLKTIEVTGSGEGIAHRSPYHTQRLEAQELKRYASQTSVEGLESGGVAFVQRSQMGGGSPILRGFEANRVLLVVDGVRLNNAIYRSGHLQNALSVDQAILEGTTLWFGPGSLIYGSDALGGVVHFETKQPTFHQGDQTRISGGYYARYADANEERSLHGHIELSGKRWASLTSVTATRYDDLRTGSHRSDEYPDFGKRLWYVDPETDSVIRNDDEDVQRYTGYDQLDVLHKQRFAISSKKFLTLNTQYSNTSDVPRYDELTVGTAEAPVWSEWYYGPQQRWLASMKYDVASGTRLHDRMQLLVHYQHISEDRHRRSFGDPMLRSNEERVQVYGANADFVKYLDTDGGRRHKITYGAAGRYHDVGSTARRQNRWTGEIDHETFTRYPDDEASMYDAGAYGHYRWEGVRHQLQAGVRYSYQHLSVAFKPSTLFEWPADFIEGITQTSHSVDWIVAGRYGLTSALWLRGSVGTAFRAPNIDDFAKVRVRIGERISAPNTALGAERTLNTELGADWHHEVSSKSKIEVGVTGYYTRIDDAIVRMPGTLPNGDSIYVLDGVPLDVVTNVNADEGYIYGLSGQMKYTLHSWTLEGSVGYQYGRSTTGDVERPLAHIPPLFGQATLGYDVGRWTASTRVMFNGRKRIEDFALDSSDNIEFATPEGSLAWTVWHVYADYDILPSVKIRLGLENITDLHYRTFSSGVSAPGRQVKVGLYGEF